MSLERGVQGSPLADATKPALSFGPTRALDRCRRSLFFLVQSRFKLFPTSFWLEVQDELMFKKWQTFDTDPKFFALFYQTTAINFVNWWAFRAGKYLFSRPHTDTCSYGNEICEALINLATVIRKHFPWWKIHVEERGMSDRPSIYTCGSHQSSVPFASNQAQTRHDRPSIQAEWILIFSTARNSCPLGPRQTLSTV